MKSRRVNFRKVKVWRCTFGSPAPTSLPAFTGGWHMGDFRKEKFGSIRTIVEEREIPFSQIHYVRLVDSRVHVDAHKLHTANSRKLSRFFHAATGIPYEGDVAYIEVLKNE